MLKVFGEVQTPCELALEDLAELPRHEQTSDLHCVTTWSRLGLRWGGYRLRDVYERLIVPRTKPDPEARWLVIRGLDGYRASLLLEDALASDVLLADRLDGEELPIEHGAPIRVVAPGHYGYKSVRHVSGLELRKHCPKSVAGPREHSRGRVALEERGEMLPGWLWRGIWRATLPATFWYYRRLRARWRQ
jgi:DMSO/TMAO reductase YedYZ molybdopterin-dependent catalytic subunit